MENKKPNLSVVPEGAERSDLESTLSDSHTSLSPEWLAKYQDALRKQIVEEVTDKVTAEYQDQIETLQNIGGDFETLQNIHRALREEYTVALRKIDELRAEARTDSLTGLFNRRSLDETLEVRASEIERGDSESLGFILMDIDHFKGVNDVYGHVAGDEILKAVAYALEDGRGSDVAFRYGGEEFAIICPNTGTTGLHEVGKKVSDAVNANTRDLAAESDPDTYPVDGVTISLGYGVMDSSEGIKDFLGRVDEALYVSKSQGRDRMTLSLGDGHVYPIVSKPHK